MTLTLPLPHSMTCLAEGFIANARVSEDSRTVVWNQLIDGSVRVMRWQEGVISPTTDTAWLAVATERSSTDRHATIWHWSDPSGRTPDRLYLIGHEALIPSTR